MGPELKKLDSCPPEIPAQDNVIISLYNTHQHQMC